jgi:hypothetical protein
MKPVVYIASPYTKGDPAINTHCQLRAFDELMNDGIVWPFIPLTSHFIHLCFPRPYQDWIDYDLALIDRFDACLRLNAEMPELDYSVSHSSGADGEVARFKELGRPVFYDKQSLYEWVKPDRQIVALCGYAGAGKDDAAKGLVAEGWTRIGFADAVKDSLLALSPLVFDDRVVRSKVSSVANLVSEGGWELAKSNPDVRTMLQRMGCEASRDIHGQDCWLKIMRRKIQAAPGNVVITDLRFKNEADAVRSWGGKVIRIDRPGVCPVNGHASEKLEFEPDEVILNDGTIEDLQGTLCDVVQEAARAVEVGK